MPKKVFVSLDMHRDSKDWEKFANLSAAKKIVLIRNRIRIICEELKKKHPDAMWIFSWHEYGIFNSPEERFIWHDLKEQFKREMLQLTNEFSNLHIIAGSVATRKTFSNTNYLSYVKRQFKKHRWISSREKDNPQLLHHQSLIEEAKKISGPFDVLTNSCYVFSRGKYQRYDKNAPFQEHMSGELKAEQAIQTIKESKSLDNISADLDNLPFYFKELGEYKRYKEIVELGEHITEKTFLDACEKISPKPFFLSLNSNETKTEFKKPVLNPLVFQPASRKNSKPIVKLKHIDGTEFTVGIDICRDHYMGVMRRHSPTVMPDLHVVISDSVSLEGQNMFGKIVVGLDSKKDVEFTMTEDMKNNNDFHVYSNNLFTRFTELNSVKGSFYRPIPRTPVYFSTLAEAKAKKEKFEVMSQDDLSDTDSLDDVDEPPKPFSLTAEVSDAENDLEFSDTEADEVRFPENPDEYAPISPDNKILNFNSFFSRDTVDENKQSTVVKNKAAQKIR